jgi:hypothetical protein
MKARRTESLAVTGDFGDALGRVHVAREVRQLREHEWRRKKTTRY